MANHVTFWVVETRVSQYAEPEAGEIVFECTPEGFARQLAGGLDVRDTETYATEAEALERAVQIVALVHASLPATFHALREKMRARAQRCWEWRKRDAKRAGQKMREALAKATPHNPNE